MDSGPIYSFSGVLDFDDAAHLEGDGLLIPKLLAYLHVDELLVFCGVSLVAGPRSLIYIAWSSVCFFTDLGPVYGLDTLLGNTVAQIILSLSISSTLGMVLHALKSESCKITVW